MAFPSNCPLLVCWRIHLCLYIRLLIYFLLPLLGEEAFTAAQAIEKNTEKHDTLSCNQPNPIVHQHTLGPAQLEVK